jgi:hypothetical protein
MVIFAAVGFLFLFFTDPVLDFFNNLSPIFGLPEAPLKATNFYLALASAFMYLVTLLAFLMYKNPDNKIYPVLLTHGKVASSVLSLYLFLTHQHYLIYITNFIVDGCIAIVLLLLIKNMKQNEAR